MTLDDIWKARKDTRLVAYRPDTLTYVALGHDTAKAAADNAGISDDDRNADDWIVGEVVSGDDGQAIGFDTK